MKEIRYDILVEKIERDGIPFGNGSEKMGLAIEFLKLKELKKISDTLKNIYDHYICGSGR